MVVLQEGNDAFHYFILLDGQAKAWKRETDTKCGGGLWVQARAAFENINEIMKGYRNNIPGSKPVPQFSPKIEPA